VRRRAYRHPKGRGLAIAVVLVGALAGASAANAEAHAGKAPLTIPDLPHDGSRFGLVIVGEPDGTAIAAREVVSRVLVDDGHPVAIVPALAAAPRREDVLRICAESLLDGVAFVSVRRGHVPALADVEVLDSNGDPFEGAVVPESVGGNTTSESHWSAPVFTASRTSFAVPMPVESPSAAEPRPAPRGPLPPLLWFDERDGSALLGERVLATGQVYRLLRRPELEAECQSRTSAKKTILAAGIAASAAGLLLGTVLWASGHGPYINTGWPSSDAGIDFFVINGALLGAGISAIAVSSAIDPNPMARHERFVRARDFNAKRLPDDEDGDEEEP
jgi:hypothetical protein